jgi:hypothetical protein
MSRNQSTNENIENQVRRRVADHLARAGVHERSVATEVLYLLPDTFVQAYMKLFERALGLGEGSSLGRGAGDEGQIKAKVKSSDVGKKVGAVGKGRGKRYHAGVWVVKDEKAFEVKRRIDKRLRRLVAEIERLMRGDLEGLTMKCGEYVEVRTGEGEKVRELLRGSGCGRFVEPEWDFCAGCGRRLK